MQPLSNDLRQRVLEVVDYRVDTRREIAKRFAIDTSTITRLLKLPRQTRSAAPMPHGGDRSSTLDAARLDRFQELVRQDPDTTSCFDPTTTTFRASP